ncbi:MAG TPA: type III-B CRISPR module-associated Cmr3 family protein [Vicinamibacterales bacterium]|nr:type III-B CRISPR module-associated Cmr3 family protein [Vicinamibacterales bacterium]
MEYRFMRPLDVLYLRGNRLFGEPGEHADALMPPWPSLFSGALRSRMLIDRGVDLHRFARGERLGDDELDRVLGTPDRPGTFRLASLVVARERAEGLETFFPPPADLFIPADIQPPAPWLLEPLAVDALSPVAFSRRLDGVPVLRNPLPAKPSAHYWLSERGFAEYLAGRAPSPDHLIGRRELWETDPRLGIALRARTRTVETGRLYTSDAVALRCGTGFLVGVAGANGMLPRAGLVRLGGDGRGAVLEEARVGSASSRIPRGDRFRLILATPGLFPSGWCPLRLDDSDGPRLRFEGLEARLVAAAVPRAHVVSGWDLARDRPKPAQRVVPAGAVYWFERLAGDLQVLGVLLEEGLWPVLEQTGQLALLDDSTRIVYEQRRAEGFNNVWLGDWLSRN